MDEVPEMITRGALNVKMTYHRSNSSKEVKNMPQNIIFLKLPLLSQGYPSLSKIQMKSGFFWEIGNVRGFISRPDNHIKVSRVGAMPTHVRIDHPKEADYDQSGR